MIHLCVREGLPFSSVSSGFLHPSSVVGAPPPPRFVHFFSRLAFLRQSLPIASHGRPKYLSFDRVACLGPPQKRYGIVWSIYPHRVLDFLYVSPLVSISSDLIFLLLHEMVIPSVYALFPVESL